MPARKFKIKPTDKYHHQNRIRTEGDYINYEYKQHNGNNNSIEYNNANNIEYDNNNRLLMDK